MEELQKYAENIANEDIATEDAETVEDKSSYVAGHSIHAVRVDFAEMQLLRHEKTDAVLSIVNMHPF